MTKEEELELIHNVIMGVEIPPQEMMEHAFTSGETKPLKDWLDANTHLKFGDMYRQLLESNCKEGPGLCCIGAALYIQGFMRGSYLSAKTVCDKVGLPYKEFKPTDMTVKH